MLKYFNANQKNFSKKLEKILNKRKLNQQSETFAVKKILNSVKRQGDKAVIKFEKKFSNIKPSKFRIRFSRGEINKI